MSSPYDQDDPEVQTKMAQVERFDNEIPDSRAVVLRDANHWIFLSHEEEVLAEISEFIAGLSISSNSD